MARGRRFNEDIYLPSERLAPSARAENIDQRRQPAHTSERSNSILKNEEPGEIIEPLLRPLIISARLS